MRAIQRTSKAFHSGALPCFYLQAAISSRSLHTSLRNPIKMTDYILSPQGLSFRKIYKSSLIIWEKAEICRTINLVWYVLLKLRYCAEQLKTVIHKCCYCFIKELGSWFVLPLIYTVICLLSHRFCFASLRCCYPSQQAGSGSLASATQEKPDSPPTFVIIQHQPRRAIKGSRPARRNPVPRHKRGCSSWSLPLIARNSISFS